MTMRVLYSYFISTMLAFVLLVCQSHAADQQQRFLDSGEFETIFRELVSHNSPWSQKDLVIEKFSATPSSLSVPSDGPISYRLLNQAYPDRLGPKTLYISVLIADQEYERIKLRGNLRLFGEVVCMAKQLDRHALLTEEDISIIRRDISDLDPRMLTSLDEALGKQLKTSLRAGAILYSHLLENPPLVKRGDLVTIVARSERVQVRVAGEVRNEGALGDLVKVKNLMSRREVYATVLGTDLVEAGL